MTRVALYARYSSDTQSAASIEDQFRICRDHAAREGWSIAACYHDAAISGASMVLRPGIRTLLNDARCGNFDVVLAEALDRVSRDQADVATLFKHLRFADLRLVTLAEGDISELHVGLKGTMNALFLKDLAVKTHRGLRGRVETGKAGGGLCYGYDVVKRLGSDGEAVRGERTVNEVQAAVVRRVFRDFAASVSPRTIARRLNDEGVPGPDGMLWTDSTLRGHAKRGTGFLNNELYIGRLVWNRQRYIKDPSTGKRVSRINPPDAWITTEVPELRIVDDALWRAAKARQEALAIQHAGPIAAVRAAFASRAANPLNATHRPRSLLSGLLVCGCCGAPYTLRGQDRYGCSRHVTNGSCANSRTIPRPALEERVLAGLKERLMAPEIAAEAIRAYAEETNRFNRERRASGEVERHELAKVARSIKDIMALIESGAGSRTLVARLQELEALEGELNAHLAQVPVDLPDVHPNIADLYARKVARLADALNRPADRDEASDAIRGLIETITLTPGPKRGQLNATLCGDLATILEWTAQKQNTPGAFASGVSVSVVAGAGFEPAAFRL